MAQSIRRGAAWRFAALGLLIATLTLVPLSGTRDVEAHTPPGPLYCGVTSFGGNTFNYEYTTWDESPATNWHVWDPYHEQPCAYY